jgi:hypothetical protein
MMSIKECQGCGELQLFYRSVNGDEYPEIKEEELCFDCYGVMTSEANALRADVDNGGH